MDREVAAGWFDIMLLDTEHKFASFMHNVPNDSFNSKNSDRTVHASEELEPMNESSLSTSKTTQ